jgi:methionyl-tRNA synthetase
MENKERRKIMTPFEEKLLITEQEKLNALQEINETLKNINTTLFETLGSKEVGEALQEIFDVLKKANKYIDDTTPWILAKDETKQDRLQTVLYNLLETIRICSVYLQAFIPETAEKIFNQLNTTDTNFESAKTFGLFKDGTVLNEPVHLFDRIELPKEE